MAVSVSRDVPAGLLLLIEPAARETPVGLVSGHQCGNISSRRKAFQPRYERPRKINTPNTEMLLEVFPVEWRDTKLLPVLQPAETMFLFKGQA